MSPASRSPSVAGRLWRAARDLTVNFAIPIVLAWALMHRLHFILHPADVRDAAAERCGYGEISLRLKLPGTHGNIPEPLISCGKIGDAALVFIVLLPQSRARVGVEFWGVAFDQGTEFNLPASDAVIDLTCDIPAFYPAPGDPAWGRIPAAVQQRKLSRFSIAVNGVVRLEGDYRYTLAPHSPIYFGVNPLGGSFVSNRFTGTILQRTQHL